MKASIAIILSLFLIPLTLHATPQSDPVKQTVSQPANLTKINLNKADVKTLTGSFKGIGTKRAQAIVAYREEHKRFNSIEQLAEVKGLGTTFVAKNLGQLKAIFTVD